MRFGLYFRVSYLVDTRLRYKYMVYSTKFTNQKHKPHEFLHGYSSNVDRCLEVPKQLCIIKSNYDFFSSKM